MLGLPHDKGFTGRYPRPRREKPIRLFPNTPSPPLRRPEQPSCPAKAPGRGSGPQGRIFQSWAGRRRRARPAGPCSLPGVVASRAAPWEDLIAFVARDGAHWLGAPMLYGRGSLFVEMGEMAEVKLCSRLLSLSLVCPSGLGEQRVVKRNNTSYSQDCALFLKPWDLPLRFILFYTVIYLILPVPDGHGDKLGWRFRDFLLTPGAGITKTHREHAAFP